jgi:hypothetical protein
VRLKKPSGILPKKLLKESVKECSFLRFPSEDGIWSSNLLFERSNEVSCVRLKKPSGILPEKLLKESVKKSSFLRFSSEDGI